MKAGKGTQLILCNNKHTHDSHHALCRGPRGKLTPPQETSAKGAVLRSAEHCSARFARTNVPRAGKPTVLQRSPKVLRLSSRWSLDDGGVASISTDKTTHRENFFDNIATLQIKVSALKKDTLKQSKTK